MSSPDPRLADAPDDKLGITVRTLDNALSRIDFVIMTLGGDAEGVSRPDEPMSEVDGLAEARSHIADAAMGAERELRRRHNRTLDEYEEVSDDE